MPSFTFHPTVQRWFEQKFGTPSEPQRRGWPSIQAGAHTLIALWDGNGGDGPGGTEAMVQAATERGFEVVRLDAGPLALHATPARSAQPRP